MAALAGVSALRYRCTPAAFIGLYGAALRSRGPYPHHPASAERHVDVTATGSA